MSWWSRWDGFRLQPKSNTVSASALLSRLLLKPRDSTAQPFVDWCTEHGVAIHYIQPGKPDQNAYIERFNRTYRTEVLNAHLFESVAELQAITDAWLTVYNQERPHDSLGRVPPLTFLPRPSSAGESTFELST